MYLRTVGNKKGNICSHISAIVPTHGSCTEALHSSYTMGTHGLPDIYTFSPRAFGPRASGVYIRQTTRAHGITIKYEQFNAYQPPTHLII